MLNHAYSRSLALLSPKGYLVVLPARQAYYPGTEEAHTNPTRERGECLRALARASG